MHAACALTVTTFAQRILPKEEAAAAPMGVGLTLLLPNSARAAMSEEEEGLFAALASDVPSD